MSTLRQLARTDSPTRLALAIAVAMVTVAVVFPGSRLYGWSTSIATIGLLVLATGCLWQRRREANDRARPFWTDLTVAASSWLVAASIGFVAADRLPDVLTGLVQEALYVVYYAVLLLASARRRTIAEAPPLWPVAVVFTVGFFGYFALLPAWVDPTRYASAQPSQLLYATLDTFLTVTFASLAWRVRRTQGFGVYAWLSLSTAATALYALRVAKVLPARSPVVDEVLWLLPLIVLVVVARTGREAPRDRQPPLEARPWPGGLVRPRVGATLAALVLPLVHFSLYRMTDLLAPAMNEVRARMILIWMAIFGTLALVQRFLLSRRMGRLADERAGFETSLRSSEQDLRLIIERRTAAEALIAAEEKFAMALRLSPDAIAISTLDDGRFLEVNPAFEALTGHRQGDIIGRTSSELGIWLDPAHRQRLVDEIRRHGGARDVELPFRSRRGDVKTALFSAQPIEIRDASYVIIVGHDVTRRRRAEREIRDQAHLLARVHEAIWTIDDRGVLTRWNRYATRLLGWAQDEAVGYKAAGRLFGGDGQPLTDLRARLGERGSWFGTLTLIDREGQAVTVGCRWATLGQGAPQLLGAAQLPR